MRVLQQMVVLPLVAVVVVPQVLRQEVLVVLQLQRILLGLMQHAQVLAVLTQAVAVVVATVVLQDLAAAAVLVTAAVIFTDISVVLGLQILALVVAALVAGKEQQI
jgi:hypothetical protein